MFCFVASCEDDMEFPEIPTARVVVVPVTFVCLQDLIWGVWTIHWSRTSVVFVSCFYCMHMGSDWSLVTNGW